MKKVAIALIILSLIFVTGANGCGDNTLSNKEIIFEADGENQSASDKFAENAKADASKSKEESMTYQIDLDSYYTHKDDYRKNTEHLVFNTQKTITRKSNYEFESEGGEDTPIKASIEGYLDSECTILGSDGGGTGVYTRGVYSGSYDGTIEISLWYINEEYANSEDQGLWVTFSQIKDLPEAPPSKLLVCATASEVGEEELNRRLHDLYAATDTIWGRVGDVTHPGEVSGPFFKSIEGGMIDISGAEDGGYNDYTWSGTLTVTRIE